MKWVLCELVMWEGVTGAADEIRAAVGRGRLDWSYYELWHLTWGRSCWLNPVSIFSNLEEPLGCWSQVTVSLLLRLDNPKCQQRQGNFFIGAYLVAGFIQYQLNKSASDHRPQYSLPTVDHQLRKRHYFRLKNVVMLCERKRWGGNTGPLWDQCKRKPGDWRQNEEGSAALLKWLKWVLFALCNSSFMLVLKCTKMPIL